MSLQSALIHERPRCYTDADSSAYLIFKKLMQVSYLLINNWIEYVVRISCLVSILSLHRVLNV